jgi:mitochondrial import inner membrane translocase subunit TIM21
MLLNFYIQGSFAKSAQSSDEEEGPSYIESLSSLTLDESIAYGREKLESIMESAKRAFRYLSGDLAQLPSPHPQSSVKEHQEKEGGQDKGLWSLAGLFSGLKGRRSAIESAGDSGVLWTDGEVHADLVRVCNSQKNISQCSYKMQNDEGYFVFRYLLIDIPSTLLFQFVYLPLVPTYPTADSESRNPVRVFVERAPGVRENEPIMRFTAV